jgi:hypothetical protein
MEYQINGDEPEIVGEKCIGLYLIQHQEGKSITDPANTVYLKFESVWSKLCFDGSTIFWRKEAPSEPVNSNVSSCLVLLNLCELGGVVGNLLEKIEYSGSEEMVSAKFTFSGGKEIEFIHNSYDDFTSINC